MKKSNVINLFDEIKRRRNLEEYAHWYDHFTRIIERYHQVRIYERTHVKAPKGLVINE